MNFGIFQIIYLALLAIGLLAAANQHGKPKTGTIDFFITLFASAVSFCIFYLGGFFK